MAPQGPGPAAIGECRITSLHDSRGATLAVYVERADPHIVIADTFLHEILVSRSPYADLRPGPGALDAAAAQARGDNLEGWLFTLRAANRAVIYRLTARVPFSLSWCAQWPD